MLGGAAGFRLLLLTLIWPPVVEVRSSSGRVARVLIPSLFLLLLVEHLSPSSSLFSLLIIFLLSILKGFYPLLII